MNISLTPLGAGDLIDRSIRLYRQNFWTMIRIATPPVIVSSIGSVLVTLGWKGTFITEREMSFAIYLLMMFGGSLLWLVGTLLTLMVVGGSARNLVRHLLWGEPITVRETYQNVRKRFFSLLGATFLVGTILFFTTFILFYGWIIALSLSIVGAFLVGTASEILGGIVGIVVGAGVTFLFGWLYFLIAGRFAYVPQVLLVEGQGVFASIGRSATLAHKNAKRLAALIIFTLFATYSALMILLMPILWYGQANGIPFFTWETDTIPAWYSITVQVITQMSFILLAPVWMSGLSLMYVDERVRNEGYDIELMAARQLGEMPPITNPNYINPLRPALGGQPLAIPPPIYQQNPSNITTLGLK
jgi:type III secretory pathway component EscS